MLEFIALAYQCSPNVAIETLAAIVKIESGYNPYAIGVVGGQLTRQPKTHAEAVATANMLNQNGYNFSMGLSQVNLKNLPHYQATIDTIFDPCTNLKIGGLILEECYVRAANKSSEQMALRQALSCYYSGNFIRGFKSDSPNMPSYVEKVVGVALNGKPIVPKILPFTATNSSPNTTAPVSIPLKNSPAATATKSRATITPKAEVDNVVIQPANPTNKVVF